MSEGTKVTYTFNRRSDKGIIKSFSEDFSHAFVVYKCNDDWHNYTKYTAQRTPIKHLKAGWPEPTTFVDYIL